MTTHLNWEDGPEAVRKALGVPSKNQFAKIIGLTATRYNAVIASANQVTTFTISDISSRTNTEIFIGDSPSRKERIFNGKALKHLRNSRNLTIKGMAAKATKDGYPLTGSQIMRAENQKSKYGPLYQTALAMSRALGIELFFHPEYFIHQPKKLEKSHER